MTRRALECVLVLLTCVLRPSAAPAQDRAAAEDEPPIKVEVYSNDRSGRQRKPVGVTVTVTPGGSATQPTTTRPGVDAGEAEEPSLTPARVIRGHTLQVNSVAFSSDGLRLVSGSDDRTVRVWDFAGGTELHCFRGHTRPVTRVAFARDGALVASGSIDATARVWDTRTGEQVAELDGHSQRVNCLVFHPDGKHLITGSCDLFLRVWHIESERVVAKYRQGSCPWDVEVTRDGSVAVTACEDGRAYVWDLVGKREVRNIEVDPEGVRTIAVTSDGGRIASFTYYRGGAVWDAATGKQLHPLRRKRGYSHDLVMSADDRFVALVGAGSGCYVFDLTTGNQVAAIRNAEHVAWCAAFAPDEKTVVTGGLGQSRPRVPAREPFALHVWDLEAAMKAGRAPADAR